MFEKEAEEYAEKHAFRIPYDGSDKFYDDKDYECSKEGFQKGAEFGYNKAMNEIGNRMESAYREGVAFGKDKATEWHYVKDEKPKDNEYVLIYTDLKNTYVARIPTEKDYFVTRRGGFIQMSAVIAWKEIVLPKESE